MKVILARDLLQANSDQAQQNRLFFERFGVVSLNLISSPGAGKTTLLEKTLFLLKDKVAVGVIEGDIFTDRDAVRIAGLDVPVVQINTQGTCHLDARMVARAMQELPLAELDLVLIENVGNLVCPAAFDLGEHYKIALLSVAEGSDKPAKYPGVFQRARAVVITKADLLPHLDFDLDACEEELLEIHDSLEIFVTSAKSGSGMRHWVNWLASLTKGPLAGRV